jgi:hypothetical protein
LPETRVWGFFLVGEVLVGVELDPTPGPHRGIAVWSTTLASDRALTARDPVLFDGNDTVLFGYAGGDPVNRIDPNGEGWWFIAALAAAVVISANHDARNRAVEAVIGGEIAFGALAAGARGIGAAVCRGSTSAATRGANTAYEAAVAGGRHAGTLRNYAGRPLAEIRRGIASYERQVALHAEKIANPARFAERWGRMSAQEQAWLIAKWQRDLARNQELADVLRGLADSLG